MVIPRRPDRLEVDGGTVPAVSPLSMARPEWWRRAECIRRRVPLSWFFVDQGGDPWPAKGVCAACPVVRDCLAFAVTERIEHGIYGGMTPSERKEARRNAQT